MFVLCSFRMESVWKKRLRKPKILALPCTHPIQSFQRTWPGNLIISHPGDPCWFGRIWREPEPNLNLLQNVGPPPRLLCSCRNWVWYFGCVRCEMHQATRCQSILGTRVQSWSSPAGNTLSDCHGCPKQAVRWKHIEGQELCNELEIMALSVKLGESSLGWRRKGLGFLRRTAWTIWSFRIEVVRPLRIHE